MLLSLSYWWGLLVKASSHRYNNYLINKIELTGFKKRSKPLNRRGIYMSKYTKNPIESKGITNAVCNFCDRIITDVTNTYEYSMIDVLPLKDVSKTFYRKSEMVNTKFSLSNRGQELLQKASHYKIPLDTNNINLLHLIDEVADYEMLLEEAHDKNVDWDISEYDPVALQKEIEYQERQEREAQVDLYRSFYNPCNLGV
jgi:hypothetical protein